jgi:hypothetical protein
MNLRGRKSLWIVGIGACLIIMAFAILFAFRHGGQNLPYHDSFLKNDAAEWRPFGGIWEVNRGAVYNHSDERGAKLVTGSADWKDYALDSDLKLIGHGGDVGLIVRVGDEERGVDSYRGYYIGLRSADSALVLGKADHGWMEGRPVPMQGGVHAEEWYHLHVVAYGCQIGAEATNIQTQQTTWAALEEQPCLERGSIGLRSMGTGGEWRGVSVETADEQAWRNIRIHTSFVAQPEFPAREADYNRMRETYFKDVYAPVRNYRNFPAGDSGDGALDPNLRNLGTPEVVPIDSLNTLPTSSQTVTIRGVVTLTSPLYVQDPSGSILVENGNAAELNLGDEIQVSGTPVMDEFMHKFKATGVRLLWDRTLVAPVSITSSQAASGGFEGSFVELRGTLASSTKHPDHTITLKMYDFAQSFNVEVPNGISTDKFANWAPGSRLLVRGICTLPAHSGGSGTAFTILAPGISSVQMLNGPPWWTGKQLVRLLILTLLLVCGAVYLYLRLERWKMAAILGERERLAHEMHDTLAQSFAGIGFHLQGLYNGMRTGHTAPPDALAMVQSACEMVAHGHCEASASIAALHPDADEGQDFLVALDHSTREVLHSGNSGSMPIRFVREGAARPLSTPVRDALFHIGREAIANMLRHANAREMELRLRYESKFVVLAIRDDGVGFHLPQLSAGMGIRGMQRRCGNIGARFEIQSAPGNGTCITVQAPYRLGPKLVEWLKPVRKSDEDMLA